MRTQVQQFWFPFTDAGLWLREARETLRLAAPLALTELSYMAIVVTDVLMMGRLGPETLAAGSLAGHFYGFIEFCALGILAAVAPILAQDLGARRFRQVRRTVRQGFWMALALVVPATVVIWQAGTLLVLLGQDPALAEAGEAYVRAMVPGLLPGLFYMVLSELLVAHGRPRAVMAIAIGGIGLNALADYALMFGHFGLPRLELVGAGVASAVVSLLMFLSLFCFVLQDRRMRRYRLLGNFWRADWPRFVEVFRLGLPIAGTHAAGIGLFLAAALLIGLLGTEALAAHAIVVQCVAVSYMIPLGIAQAATVRVGRAVGAGDPEAAARAGWTAMALAGGYAVLPALAFWFWGGPIVALFLDFEGPEEEATVALAVSLLAVGGLFQIGDAVQETATGALRGLKDTRGPLMMALAAYWGLGFPAAALFGVYFELGSQAVWASLALALSALALLLLSRFRAQLSGRGLLSAPARPNGAGR